MAPRITVVCNQKGGVGKTTVAMNLAACAAEAGPLADPADVSPVMVVSTDPQASSVWWSNRVENLPFHFRQIDRAADVAALRERTDLRHIVIDTPGSLEDSAMLVACLRIADFAVVPVVPEALCFEPTARTIDNVIKPLDVPFKVLVNLFDPRDGLPDLKGTATWLTRMGYPMANTPIRRLKIHARAAALGTVCTRYAKSRTALEAAQDFYRAALETGLDNANQGA